MKNKLFLTCPFSCMESVLQNKYGDDIFFLTCAGAVLENLEPQYWETVKAFVLREKINTIYIVNDTSCVFINTILTNGVPFGLPAEAVIGSIYEDHYQTEFKGKSLLDQQLRLAEMNVERQISVLTGSSEIRNCITEGRLVLKGLVTSKASNLFSEVIIKSNNNKIYEF